MTEEPTTTDEIPAVFVGTRTKGPIRQLAYQIEGEVYFVEVDTKAYLAGERIVKAAEKAFAMRVKAIDQGLVKEL